MLRKIDCRPGVEVIAIKNISKYKGKPALSIGAVYTIKGYADCYYDYKKRNQRVDIPCVCIHEIPLDRDGSDWAYFLDQFKLRDRFELDRLFKINNIDRQLIKEMDFEGV